MKYIYLFITILAMILVSCNRDDSHIIAPTDSEQLQGGVILGFDTKAVPDKKFSDTHLYGFDAAQKMIIHRYYATQKELSSDMFAMKNGTYTFVVVLNVGESFAPATRAAVPLHDVSLSQFLNYVKQEEGNYPDMLTGIINRTIATGKVERIEIPLSEKSGGITTSTVTVNISLPDAEFAAYQKARTKATGDYNLRGVVEFYRKGTNELVLCNEQILKPTSGTENYTLTTDIANGDYDLLLWADYTESGSTADLWYDTKSLQAVKLIASDKSYATSNDVRETFYGTITIAANGSEISANIATVRPQAKYRLIADDVMRYRELMAANPDKYPPLNELSVSILYESYLPDGFNVKDGKPNSSQQGYKCEKTALPSVGANDTEMKIGSDYVFVNGAESSVTVTVLLTDKEGRTVSRVQNVTVLYKRNMLTTVRGNFLTAGVVNSGINIDTDWDGIYNVEF